jgi:arylformamidase
MNHPENISRIIDISVGLSPDTPVWPGAPRFQFTLRKIPLDNDEEATDSNFAMVPHCGTHIDAPLHIAKGGATIDAVPLDLLVGPCVVLEHRGEGHISKDDLSAMGFQTAKRVLIKTLNSGKLRNRSLDENFLSLLPDALDHLLQSGVQVLGVDGFSIGPFGDMTVRNHLVFCHAGGIIIEVLDLSDAEPGEYLLVALPLKIETAEAAPARVVLIPPETAKELL